MGILLGERWFFLPVIAKYWASPVIDKTASLWYLQSDPVSTHAIVMRGCFNSISSIPAKRRASEFSELLTETRLLPREKIDSILIIFLDDQEKTQHYNSIKKFVMEQFV